MKQAFIEDTLKKLQEHGLKRSLSEIQGAQSACICIGNEQYLNFCSNNYLGLANDPRLNEAVITCINEQGWGAGASRLVCGNFLAHTILEDKIAEFKGAEKCLVFSTGYMANVGIISALFNREDIIFSDRLNHASIIDGIKISQAKMKRYPHKDMDALEHMLKSSQHHKKRVIVTDSVFSMDGDITPLDKIVRLAKIYNCMVMIDEAHAFGVLGEKGKGAAEHFNLEDQVDIQMGTLSKAIGSFGAYCCGSKFLIDFLINKSRSFIYTTGLPPSVAAASYQGIKILEQEPYLRKQLWDHTLYMLKELKRIGFNTLQSQTPIIPIFLGEASLAVSFSQKLLKQGIYISAIRPPTVPQNTARLRITIMATHSKEQLDFTLEQMFKIGKELCII